MSGPSTLIFPKGDSHDSDLARYALLLTAAFLPGTLAAQYSSGDSGQYVILSAQYGTNARHVDVNDRLKEIARQDRTFRMGNSTFGVEPDPGHVKTLRIYAKKLGSNLGPIAGEN